MTEAVLYCPLCKNESSQVFDKRLFRGLEVVNRVCQNCGLVFESPRMNEAESAAFYAEEYRLLNEGSVDPTARNITAQQARAGSLLAFTQPLVARVSRHLDIGCSMGILLQRFAANYHCQPAGIEPGDAHRARAIQSGLSVYASLEELQKAQTGRFDLISLAHVLEHLPDPVGYLTRLRDALLDPQGWVLIEVPNLYAHDSFEVAHLVSFSAHTLSQTLEMAGFEVVKLEQHGRPRSAVLPLYITLLARPNASLSRSKQVKPERLVSLKRRVGMARRKILEKLLPGRAWLKE